jgi:hypothetical protein
MVALSKIQFEPKWKEELVCTMDGRRFVVELTMGVLTVYFPTLAKWESSAPEWAKKQWERARADLSDWCEHQKIPLVIEDHAWVSFRTMSINEAVARMALRIEPIEDLPHIATEALCQGVDSTALRMLAASDPHDQPNNLRQLLTKAAQELGIGIPDEISAARALLPLYLRDITEGRVLPEEGVRNILYDLQFKVGYDTDKSHDGEGLGIGTLLRYYERYSEESDFSPRGGLYAFLNRSIVDEANRLLRGA